MNMKFIVILISILMLDLVHAGVEFSENFQNLKVEIGKTTRSEFLDKNSCLPYPDGIREGDRCECREKKKGVSECKKFWILRGELELENTKFVHFNDQGVLDFIEVPIDVGNGAPVSDIIAMLKKRGYSDIAMKKITYNESGFDGGPDEIYFGESYIGVVWCHVEYAFKDKEHDYLLSVNGAFGDSVYTKEMIEAGIPSKDALINYNQLDPKFLKILENECKNEIANGEIIIRKL